MHRWTHKSARDPALHPNSRSSTSQRLCCAQRPKKASGASIVPAGACRWAGRAGERVAVPPRRANGVRRGGVSGAPRPVGKCATGARRNKNCVGVRRHWGATGFLSALWLRKCAQLRGVSPQASGASHTPDVWNSLVGLSATDWVVECNCGRAVLATTPPSQAFSCVPEDLASVFLPAGV